MWTVIGGFSRTLTIPFESIQLSQTINDPAAALTFDVDDPTATLNFNMLDEVIIWNEAASPIKTISQRIIPAIPSHNLTLPLPSGWTLSGALSSLINNSGFPPVMTFSNTTYSGGNNTGFLICTTPSGYIHPGQSYMLSIYATITAGAPLVNAQGVIKIDFLDGGGNVIGGSSVQTTFTSTTNNATQQFSISGVAPANAAQITASFGGQALVSGTNSGVITYGAVQLEPMWFTALGVSYPTPDINQAQVNCYLMPDNTCSRGVRLFSGIINDIKKEYIGPVRQWHIQCAGPGILLENGSINTSYTNFTDVAILTDVITTYFSGQIAINAANVVLPAPLVAGVTLSSISYSDNTLREVLNGLVDTSGYIFYIDPYYRLYYQPQFVSIANFTLTDTNPDNVISFPYYSYLYESDGTQLKRRIKINGGPFSGNKQDIFSGNGSTKQFTLTYIPDQIASITVGGTAQRQGVSGRDTFSGPYDVLVNTQSKFVLFNVAPPNSANNTVVTYTYKAPITTQTSMQTSGVVAPAYTQPLFDAKVNDTNITDLTTATIRGLAEIVKAGSPLQVLVLCSQQFAPAGQSIYFTSTPDGIVNQPYVAQGVTGRMLGKSEIFGVPVNEFQYTLGAYQPTLHDQIRNTNKALNRSSTVANVTAAQQFDVVAMETIGYRDSLSATVQTNYANSVYGTGHYGSNSYGGATGKYGGPGTYGQGTIYG